MSEIEKLYKNARVEPYLKKGDYNFSELSQKEYVVEYDTYPPFTAEKQLELIKWLASRKVYEQTDYLNLGIWAAFGEYAMGVGVEPFNDRLGFDLAEKDKTFEVCLAKLMNALWQDLTEEEQEQIRSILNG